MDSQTIFTKTAKGLMEATGKTSALSRDLRALLREIDGKATVAEVQARYDRMSEAKLLEALQGLANDDYVREFTRSVQTPARGPRSAAPPPRHAAAESEGEDLDFTAAPPPASTAGKQAEEAARQKAQARAAAEAAARAKAEAEARAKAAAEAAARAKVEAAARAKAEAEARARIAAEAAAKAKAEAEAKARAEAAARAKAEAEARAKREAEERARREAEEKARKEAEARAKAEEQARIEAEARARKEAEERARVEARLEEERRAREEAERRAREQAERERKEAEEKARREADELRAKLEEERKAREEAERKVKEQAERERKEAEERARREADELRAKLEEERKAREDAERRAKEEAERQRKEAEEKARREADELRAKLEEERKAREEAERRAKEDAERRAKEDAERKAREEAERERQQAEENARREAEMQARREAEERAGAQEQARSESETRARRDAEAAERAAKEAAERERREAEEAERKAKEASERARREAEEAERKAKEAAERARRETEDAERRAKEASERARREAEEKAARAAAEQARAQAPVESGPSLDDLVKIETDFDALAGAAAPAKAEAERPRDSADDRMLRAVEEQARREAEEKARSAAEEKARQEAEAAAQRAEEEAGRKGEAEERRPKAGELPGTREQQLAEAQALMRAQDAETERHFAEMEKELDAEQAAGQATAKPVELPPVESPRDERKREKAERKRDKDETRERVRAAAAERALEAEAERAPAVYRTPINWGKPAALGLFLLLVLSLVLVHFVSFDGSIPQFEKLAAAHLQQPVKIKALHLSLVPQPHWRLDGVSVGNEGQLAVPRVNATAELGSMFSDKKVFKSIELESPVLSEQGLVALLFGKSQGQDFKVASIIVKNGKLDSKTIILPALDAKIALGEDGAWRQIALETPDHKTSLMLKPEGEGAELEVETNAFSLPFDPSFILENFTAKGVIRRGELKLSELKGGIYGGFLSGNASLKWGTDWSLGGDVSVRVMDPARFAPALFEEGKLEGKAVYAMRAKSYDELFAAPRVEGNFSIQKGILLGVELGRLLQGGGVGGKSPFTELTGSFTREAGRTQLRQILLGAGPVSAGGSAEADAGKRLSGRFTVEMKSPVAQARANLALSGTLREPRFSR